MGSESKHSRNQWVSPSQETKWLGGWLDSHNHLSGCLASEVPLKEEEKDWGGGDVLEKTNFNLSLER